MPRTAWNWTLTAGSGASTSSRAKRIIVTVRRESEGWIGWPIPSTPHFCFFSGLLVLLRFGESFLEDTEGFIGHLHGSAERRHEP